MRCDLPGEKGRRYAQSLAQRARGANAVHGPPNPHICQRKIRALEFCQRLLTGCARAQHFVAQIGERAVHGHRRERLVLHPQRTWTATP